VFDDGAFNLARRTVYQSDRNSTSPGDGFSGGGYVFATAAGKTGAAVGFLLIQEFTLHLGFYSHTAACGISWQCSGAIESLICAVVLDGHDRAKNKANSELVGRDGESYRIRSLVVLPHSCHRAFCRYVPARERTLLGGDPLYLVILPVGTGTACSSWRQLPPWQPAVMVA